MLGAGGLRSSLPAQDIGSRTRFVFHVYVDPLHGDDTKARSIRFTGGMNPTGRFATNAERDYLALSKHLYHKNQSRKPKVSDGYLQHAPYAFRTVNGAMRYLGDEFGSPKTVLGTYQRWTVNLPWKKPYREGGDPDLYIDYIVVHCLEGIYGPIKTPNSQGEEIDPKSGLPYNGETFPIYLPDRVSIQGTSALSTVFDARYDYVPIILVGENLNEKITYEDCFIDSLTIRGARANENNGFPNGAGIHIFREDNVYVVISNCFITDNWVGISIDNDDDISKYRHSPIIVNNTIAWNRVGIWSGDSFYNQNRIGYAFPRVFNNIIDSGDPYGHFGPINSTATAPFWGLDTSDLLIRVGPLMLDFNAYETAVANSPKPMNFLPFWPGTSPRSPGIYSPRVDIRAYTHAGLGTARGSLYINDIFRNSQSSDRSPHDFRLAPLVSLDTNPPSSTALNPLVNQGYLTFPIDFANNSPYISYNPGLPSPGSQGNKSVSDYAALHSMDWDGEGFGNPRIASRTGFQPGQYSDLDLGADEMGLTIAAGFIEGTRIFSRNVPNGEVGSQKGTLPITDHTQVYFFNLPGTYPRPWFVKWTGRNYVWWDYVQIPSFTPNPSGRYTKGVTYSFRNVRIAQSVWEPFMKGLECDTSPHLLPDTHPFWATYFESLTSPNPLDYFGSNPWYHHNWDDGGTPPQLSAIETDNKYLYYDPNVSILLEGTANPPGSWVWTQGWGYLGPGPYTIFGPFGYQGSTNYTVLSSPAWGYGDSAPGPDIIPMNGWSGERYCLQDPNALVNPLYNMQTFLGINNEDPTGKGAGAKQSPKKGSGLGDAKRLKYLEASLVLEMRARAVSYANKVYRKKRRK